MSDFNQNLIILFNKLISDKELAKGFSNCETLDEFYDFCFEIVQGYTKEELHNFLEVLSALIYKEENDKIILRDDLEKIHGGKNTLGMSKKYLAGILGALNVMSAVALSDFGAQAALPPLPEHRKTQKTTIYKNIVSKLNKLSEPLIAGSAAGVVIGAATYYIMNSANSSDIRGIGNVGNSCYMNAIIQQLYSIRAFREELMLDRSVDKKAAALQGIFSIMDRDGYAEAGKIEGYIKDLGHNLKQADASEFLVSGLTDLLSKYRLDGFFPSYINIDDLSDGTSLSEALKHGGNTDIEKLDDAVLVFLLSKGIYEPTRKELEEGRETYLSTVTDLQVRRNYNGEVPIQPIKGQFGLIINRTAGDRKSKITKNILIDDVLTVKDGNVNRNYRLTGAVVHCGDASTIQSGHYISYKREGDDWVRYNDKHVNRVSYEEVKNDINKNGIMFIYTVQD